MSTTREQLDAAPVGTRVNYNDGEDVYYIKRGIQQWERFNVLSGTSKMHPVDHAVGAPYSIATDLDGFKAHILAVVEEAKSEYGWCSDADDYLAGVGLGPRYTIEKLKKRVSEVSDEAVAREAGRRNAINRVRDKILAYGEPVKPAEPAKPVFAVGTVITQDNLNDSRRELPVGTMAETTAGRGFTLQDHPTGMEAQRIWRRSSGFADWSSGMTITYIPDGAA